MLLVLCLLASFAIQSWLLAKLASKSDQAPNTDVGQTMLASFARPLRHAENCLAQGTLVLPVWSSASFWPLLLSDSGQGFAHFIKETLLLPTGKEYYTTGACNSIFGREDLKFDMLALRIDFSKW